DVLEGGVAVVPVRAPTAGTDVHFNITGAWGRIANLDDCPAKIRTAFKAAKPRMKDYDRLAVQGLELIAQQALVLPDALQQRFGRRSLVFVKDGYGAGAHAPLGIKTG